jgi:hypothetical protein
VAQFACVLLGMTPLSASFLSADSNRVPAHPAHRRSVRVTLCLLWMQQLLCEQNFMIDLLFAFLHLPCSNMFNTDRTADAGLIFIFFVAQIVQFLLILLMTLTLVRQINKSYVSPGFLIQSWLATVSLFAGLYTLLYLLVPGYQSFHGQCAATES